MLDNFLLLQWSVYKIFGDIYCKIMFNNFGIPNLALRHFSSSIIDHQLRISHELMILSNMIIARGRRWLAYQLKLALWLGSCQDAGVIHWHRHRPWKCSFSASQTEKLKFQVKVCWRWQTGNKFNVFSFSTKNLDIYFWSRLSLSKTFETHHHQHVVVSS